MYSQQNGVWEISFPMKKSKSFFHSMRQLEIRAFYNANKTLMNVHEITNLNKCPIPFRSISLLFLS